MPTEAKEISNTEQEISEDTNIEKDIREIALEEQVKQEIDKASEKFDKYACGLTPYTILS